MLFSESLVLTLDQTHLPRWVCDCLVGELTASTSGAFHRIPPQLGRTVSLLLMGKLFEGRGILTWVERVSHGCQPRAWILSVKNWPTSGCQCAQYCWYHKDTFIYPTPSSRFIHRRAADFSPILGSEVAIDQVLYRDQTSPLLYRTSRELLPTYQELLFVDAGTFHLSLQGHLVCQLSSK